MRAAARAVRLDGEVGANSVLVTGQLVCYFLAENWLTRRPLQAPTQHPLPHPYLLKILLRAYQPCPGFNSPCECMRWNPTEGHVPRAFCGATGRLDEVELVLVCAQPGDPYPNPNYPAIYTGKTKEEMLRATCQLDYHNLCNGTEPFERNIRYILDLCYPEMSFDDQMRRTWFTNSVKCSAPEECGDVPIRVCRECREWYLDKELALFPSVLLVVAVGQKPDKRLRDRREVEEVARGEGWCYWKSGELRVLRVVSATLIGVSRKKAEASWSQIPVWLKQNRQL